MKQLPRACVYAVFSEHHPPKNSYINLFRIPLFFHSVVSIGHVPSDSVRSLSSPPSHNNIVQEFLQNSCGLSLEQAILASKPLIHLKSTQNIEQALQFFKERGFDSTQVRNLVSRRPQVLVSSVSETLQPKMRVFEDLGMGANEMASIISKRPSILSASIEKKLLPGISFLRSMVGSDKNVVKILMREPWILTGSLEKNLKPNLVYLQEIGIAEKILWTFWVRKPRFLMSEQALMKDVLDTVDKLGVPRHSAMFPHAVIVVSSMAKSTLERKMDCLVRLGLSEEEARMAFRRLPYIFAGSEKKLQSHMDFLVNSLKYEPSVALSYPQFFTISLKSRIMPRYRVLQALQSMQLPEENFSAIRMFSASEKIFLEKFVFKYGKSSGLYEIYKGNDGIVFSPELGVKKSKCEEFGLKRDKESS